MKAAYPGWSVVRHTATSKIRLRVRSGDRCVGEQAVLPLKWEARNVAEAMQWIGRIYKLIYAEGSEHTLKTARDAVLGKTTTHTEKKDWTWEQICEKYRNHLQTRKNRIKDTTFESSYGRYWEVMLKLLRSRTAPRTGAQLLDAVLSAPRVSKKPGKLYGTPLKTWGEQDASRLECSLAIKNLLTYAVSMDYRPAAWLIPESLYEDLRGAETINTKEKSDLTDIEILEFIQAIEQRNQGWASVLRLIATYGLRPCEADRYRHLELRTNSRGQEALYCTYRKKAGKRLTAERWLVPLPFIDIDGEQVWWEGWRNLNDLPWPSVDRVDGAALGKFIRRQPEWKALVAEKAKHGRQLKPYAFRDSYTHRCGRFGISDADAALASGHSTKVHRESYITTGVDTMLDAFERAVSRT